MYTVEPLYNGHSEYGNLSNEDTVCSAIHIELCTILPLNEGHLSMQDSQQGPHGVLYRRFNCTQSTARMHSAGQQACLRCSSRVVVCEKDTNHTERVLCMYQVFD